MEARTYLETITVLDIPVAVFSDGSIEAAEIGPFPFSCTGYRLILGEDKPLFRQKVVKILEITSRDYAKDFAGVVKRTKKTLTQKAGNDPVSDYIHLTGDLQTLLSYGYFQAWETTAEILHIALKLVKACEKITIPENYHETCHPNWPADYLRQRIDNVQVIEPVLQRCLAAKNLYELAATPCIDHLVCTNSVYARLFETTVLPTLSPSAEYYFYCRICVERGVTVVPEASTDTLTPSFYHPVNGNWTQHPLPDPNPMLLASDMPHAICKQCPLSARAHILVPSESDKNSYTKYCTITAIAAGLITSDAALQNDRGIATEDENFVVDALVQRFSGSCTKCLCQKECIQQPIGSDTECLAQRDKQSTWVDVVSPVPTPADPVAVGPAHSPVKTTYILGWQSAETPDHGPLQLYAIKTKKDFGVTYNPSEATGFKTIDAALGYYRQIGHLHGDPDVNIYNGFLQIFQRGPAGLRQVPKITRQGSLFDAIEPGDWDQPALPKVVK